MILILSVVLLTVGIYLKYGLEIALIETGIYMGVIAFAMATGRRE